MREKQESKLALAERKIIIAGRMGENDARRGKPRKDFSVTNKSQEYVSSYNVGYDKIALQRIQTKKRQMPSSSLPVNPKRTKIVREEGARREMKKRLGITSHHPPTILVTWARVLETCHHIRELLLQGVPLLWMLFLSVITFFRIQKKK